jgi:predicted PurR-regulated permease PerM
MTIDLTTTNVLLGIMAVVSVLEALALIAAGVMGMRLYRQTTEQINKVTDQVTVLEQKYAEPLSAQAASILQTVQRIASRVEHSTSRVDSVVDSTVHSAEVAADRVQTGVRKTTNSVVRGVRTAIETFLADQPTNGRPAASKANGYQRSASASPTPSPVPEPAPPSVEPF